MNSEMRDFLIQKVKRLLIKIYMWYSKLFEKSFKDGKCDLKYLLFKKRKTKKLLVIFSAYPGEGQKARYNYVMKFRSLRTSRLYILDDFGPKEKGAYYLGADKEFYIEKAVYCLIEKVRHELGVEKANVVTCGSSKGGYAAIYFENRYNYGASISGAPQILLGDYLYIYKHRPLLEYIMGSISEENRRDLNEKMLQSIIRKKGESKISILVSSLDGMYEDHVKKLFIFAKDYNIHIDVSIQDYKKHSDIGLYFPKYAMNQFNLYFNEMDRT